MNLYQEKDKNIFKTYLFISLFLVFIIGLGWFLSLYLQYPQLLYIAVGFSFVATFISYWFSHKIALAISHAKPIEKANAPELYNLVENLAITAGLPTPKIYIIPGEQINAFATGRNPEHAVIAVTQGALKKLNKNELQGVLAHELSHIGNRDILISSVVVVLAGVVAMISDWFLRMMFYGFGDSEDKRVGAAMLVVAVIAAILSPLIATVIQLAISRKREFLADATGALLTRYPEGLASALEKIGHDHVSLPQASNANAHLYISNPFRGKRGSSWIAKLFMTHPPIEERVKILKGMKI